MDQRLARALRARGLDVQTALDADMIERPDEDHLAHAAEHDRVLYSFNVGDFYRLHTRFLEQGRGHAGVVLAQQQRYAVGEQMRRLLALAAGRTEEEMRNRVPFGLGHCLTWTVVLIAHRLPGRSRTWTCVYVPGARGVWLRRARTTRCARAGSRAFARRPEMQRL